MTTGVSYGDIGTQFDLESAGRLMVEAPLLGGYSSQGNGSRRLSQGSPPAADPHPHAFTEHFQLLQPVADPALDGQQHPLSSYD